ncbi:hypothetical protein ABZZ80_30755 [Streptomyces sp. NPDC006356]
MSGGCRGTCPCCSAARDHAWKRSFLVSRAVSRTEFTNCGSGGGSPAEEPTATTYPPGSRRALAEAAPWAGRVDAVEVPELPGLATEAVLVRPDGYICWASGTPLTEALRRWFGAPRT